MFRRVALRAPALVKSLRSPSVSRVGLNILYVRHNSTNPQPLGAEQQAKLKDQREKLQADWDAPKLTYEQVKPRTEQPSTDAYLIDVREPDEVIQGSIPSSVNLPLSTLTNSLHLHGTAFKEKHGFEKPRKDQEIVFYCRSGKRSTTACDVAKRNGFTNLFNYEGSWLDWTARESGSK